MLASPSPNLTGQIEETPRRDFFALLDHNSRQERPPCRVLGPAYAVEDFTNAVSVRLRIHVEPGQGGNIEVVGSLRAFGNSPEFRVNGLCILVYSFPSRIRQLESLQN